MYDDTTHVHVHGVLRSSFASMTLRAIEPRTAVSLTIMSLAFLTLLRRSGAFRGVPLLPRRACCKDGSLYTTRSSSSAAGAGGEAAVQARVAGPEGTELPSVMHRIVGGNELKVRSTDGRKLALDISTCLA